MRIRFTLFRCLILVCLVLLLDSSARSQPAAQPEPAIRQLLEEVRELRVFLQKTGAINQRAQVLLERIRMQQQRVDSLSREQEEVRVQVKQLERRIPQSQENIALWEKKVELAETPNQRVDWEQAVRDLRRQSEAIKKDLQEYKDREVQLAGRISAETAKLEELNSRLDVIEREMDYATAEIDQPKTKKP